MQANMQRVAGRRGSSANAEATRQAALDLFVRNGFEATSMREIARHVGVSAATIYNYTDSKESLLWDLVRQVREDLDLSRERATFDSTCPPAIIMEALTAMARYHVENPRECQVLATAAGGLSPDHADQLEQSLTAELAFFESLIAATWPDTIVEPADLRVTAMMLVEATKLGHRVGVIGGPESVPGRVARFGLRAVGVKPADHVALCRAPGQCSVAQLAHVI